jgi:Tfp pilus assembly protein PilF
MEAESAELNRLAALAADLGAEDPDVWNDYGVALFHSGRLPEALAALDRAIALQPDYGYRFAARAWMRQAIKDFDGAREDYGQAIALDPTDAISINNLGLLEEQIGHFRSARERFAAADALSTLLEETGIPTEPVAVAAVESPDVPAAPATAWGWMRHAVVSAEGRREFFAFLRSGLTFRG